MTASIDDIKKKIAERDGLRCARTGKEVTSIDDLHIEHIKPTSQTDNKSIDNLVLVTRKEHSDTNNRKLGALAGGAIFGASLFGLPGAIFGGVAGVLLGNAVIDEQEDDNG